MKPEIRRFLEICPEAFLDEPLAKHTSMGVGGPARVLAYPRDEGELAGLLECARGVEWPVLVLGAGTNLVVRDGGFPGLVVSLDRFCRLELGEGEIAVQAGVRLGRLLEEARETGRAGLEFLAGIPGSFGGAVVTNAGAWGKSLGDVVFEVTIMDQQGRLQRLTAGELEFVYRGARLPGGSVVLSGRVRVVADAPEVIGGRMEEVLRQRRKSQPWGVRSAGCIFKNPPGMYAGELIEAAGLSGLRIGGAQVSPVHANFIVNCGGARAADVEALIELIRRRVEEKYKVRLELEVQLVGVPSARSGMKVGGG